MACLKKVYDTSTGTYTQVDRLTGAGIFDILSKVGSKIFSESAKTAGKKALETAGKQIIESGSKKLGDEVGKMAADKLVSVIKPKPKGEMILKELTKAATKDVAKVAADNIIEEDVNTKINRLLSGRGIHVRINRLINRK